MLKIKDNVDLEELEKFGFDDFGVCYKRYGTLGEQYFINKGTREIKRIHPYSFREEPIYIPAYDISEEEWQKFKTERNKRIIETLKWEKAR